MSQRRRIYHNMKKNPEKGNNTKQLRQKKIVETLEKSFYFSVELKFSYFILYIIFYK